MQSRFTLTAELEQLQEDIQEMGAFAKQAALQSIQALKTLDRPLAKQIIQEDAQMNDLEARVDERIFKVVATQQPVATDLRKIIAMIKISTDLERIGDLAVEIAKSALEMGEKPIEREKDVLDEMGNEAAEMISRSLQAFAELDIEGAFQLEKMDDRLDKRYVNILNNIVEREGEDAKVVPRVVQLAYIARSLERIGDHCTNIAEQVIFVVKGDRRDLNR